MDANHLKNGHPFTDEYFDRQLETIREIRLSERKFYQKITDRYTTAFDYDATAPTTKSFFCAGSQQAPLSCPPSHRRRTDFRSG